MKARVRGCPTSRGFRDVGTTTDGCPMSRDFRDMGTTTVSTVGFMPLAFVSSTSGLPSHSLAPLRLLPEHKRGNCSTAITPATRPIPALPDYDAYIAIFPLS